MKVVNLAKLARVAEPEFQYGAEAFEAHQKGAEKAITDSKAIKNVSAKKGKTDSYYRCDNSSKVYCNYNNTS